MYFLGGGNGVMKSFELLQQQGLRQDPAAILLTSIEFSQIEPTVF